MNSLYCIYIESEGTPAFKTKDKPCLVLAVLIPYSSIRPLHIKFISEKANLGIMPYAFCDWMTLKNSLSHSAKVGNQIKKQDKIISPFQMLDRAASLKYIYHIIDYISESDVKFIVCITYPHAMLEFKRLKQTNSKSDRINNVWIESFSMVIQRAHIFLNNNSSMGSIVTSIKNPIITSPEYAFITAPNKDKYISYRKLIDTIFYAEPDWSIGLQIGKLFSGILHDSFLQATDVDGIISRIKHLFIRNNNKEILGCGIIALPRKKNKLFLNRVTTFCKLFD